MMKSIPARPIYNNVLNSVTVMFAKVTAVEVLGVQANICVTKQFEPRN